MAAHNFVKVSLLHALAVTHDYYIICLLGKLRDSSISNEDERIRFESYNLLREDHPSYKKRRGVCMYYKEHLKVVCTIKTYGP